MSDTRDADERPRLRLIGGLDPLQSSMGPYYEIDLPQTGWRSALLLQQRHLGADGGAHAAVLSALGELAMRRTAFEHAPEHSCTLAQLSLQVLGTARPDQWLYCEALVVGHRRGLLFLMADLFNEGGAVASASAVWRLGHPA